MLAAPLPCATLLEIERAPDGRIPAALIRAAYLASRSGPVMLALNAVSRDEVDRVLDPVVAWVGTGVRGVVYADLHDDGLILRTASRASHVFASSDAFRAKLALSGIPFRHADDLERDVGR